MCVTVSLKIAKTWSNQDVPRWVGEWINKLRYVHTMEYHPASKRNKLMIYATTWMNHIYAIFAKQLKNPDAEVYVL